MENKELEKYVEIFALLVRQMMMNISVRRGEKIANNKNNNLI